jgi:predicted 3-demethylubiquinone-9 3-methyltransferase (glyoxalase superfamily)
VAAIPLHRGHIVFRPTRQQEVEELWEKLSAGGKKIDAAGLKDKYGLSWQIIPAALGALLRDKDPQKLRWVMQAMLQMDQN